MVKVLPLPIALVTVSRPFIASAMLCEAAVEVPFH